MSGEREAWETDWSRRDVESLVAERDALLLERQALREERDEWKRKTGYANRMRVRAVRALQAYFAERDDPNDEFAGCAPTDATEARMRAAISTQTLHSSTDVEAEQEGQHKGMDKAEEMVLNAVSEMFPDFDFGGCYDLNDLLSHTIGQANALRERAEAAEELWADLKDTEDYRLKRAEERVAALEAALREIAACDWRGNEPREQVIARAALQGNQTEPTIDSPYLVDALESLLDTNDWRDIPSREMAEKMIVLVKLAFDLAAAGRRIGKT